MATGGDRGQQLTNRQIVRLASAITANNMAAVAEGYMDIDETTIKNKRYENKDDAQAFNREILKVWIYKNSRDVKVSHWVILGCSKLCIFMQFLKKVKYTKEREIFSLTTDSKTKSLTMLQTYYIFSEVF